MKTIKIKATIIAMILVVNAFGQTPPPTPKTPNSNNKHTEVTSSISNHTSISNSNKTYRFTAKFERSKKRGVEERIAKVFKQWNAADEDYVEEKNGKVFLECSFYGNKLKIVLHKKLASYRDISKVKKLGEELRSYISAHKYQYSYSYDSSSIREAKRRVAAAKRELQRATERLEELEKRN